MGKKHKNKYKPDKDLLEDIDMPQEKTSLKLVLKVGGAPSTPEVMIDSLTDDNYSDTDRKQRHKKKKRHHDKHSSHRHHDRKDFRKLEADTEDGEDSEEEMEPVPKRLHLDEDEEDDHLHVRNLREKKSNEDDKTPLQLCLNYLHKILQRKDSNGFFAFPVTDNIAPGYSSIISHPMDFSTMKAKIDDSLYSSVAEFRCDYELMMNNCMMYNHPDTVYHKEAKRLLSVGLRHMSREKLVHMKRGLPFMTGVTNQELGLDDESMAANTADDAGGGGGGSGGGSDGSRSLKTLKAAKVKKSSLGRFEAVPDDMTAEEILDQAQNAAQDAANKVMLQSPDSKIGFLRRKEDGTTTLNILNPDDSGFISEKERVVNLGSLIGKLATGSGTLVSTKEDKRNKVSPVIYLNYGAFSSYAPIYDSSSANIGKEDSDLLLSTYADETGVQYAKSLRHFVTDAGDYTISMVDDLLNVLTSGEHSKVMAMLEQEEKEKQEQEVEITEPETDEAGADIDQPSVTSSSQTKNNLDGIGIEMSFLNNFDHGAQQLEDGNQETQKKLDSAAELIMDLQRTQYERLSEKLPEHLAYVRDPSKEEIELANKVTRKLTELVKQVTPGDVVKAESVRAAMGIAMLPSNDDIGDSARAVSSSASSSSWPASQASPAIKSGDDIGGGRNTRTDEMSELDDDLLDLFQQGTSTAENDLTGNQPDALAEDQMDVAS